MRIKENTIVSYEDLLKNIDDDKEYIYLKKFKEYIYRGSSVKLLLSKVKKYIINITFYPEAKKYEILIHTKNDVYLTMIKMYRKVDD